MPGSLNPLYSDTGQRIRHAVSSVGESAAHDLKTVDHLTAHARQDIISPVKESLQDAYIDREAKQTDAYKNTMRATQYTHDVIAIANVREGIGSRTRVAIANAKAERLCNTTQNGYLSRQELRNTAESLRDCNGAAALKINKNTTAYEMHQMAIKEANTFLGRGIDITQLSNDQMIDVCNKRIADINEFRSNTVKNTREEMVQINNNLKQINAEIVDFQNKTIGANTNNTDFKTLIANKKTLEERKDALIVNMQRVNATTQTQLNAVNECIDVKNFSNKIGVSNLQKQHFFKGKKLMNLCRNVKTNVIRDAESSESGWRGIATSYRYTKMGKDVVKSVGRVTYKAYQAAAQAPTAAMNVAASHTTEQTAEVLKHASKVLRDPYKHYKEHRAKKINDFKRDVVNSQPMQFVVNAKGVAKAQTKNQFDQAKRLVGRAQRKVVNAFLRSDLGMSLNRIQHSKVMKQMRKTFGAVGGVIGKAVKWATIGVLHVVFGVIGAAIAAVMSTFMLIMTAAIVIFLVLFMSLVFILPAVSSTYEKFVTETTMGATYAKLRDKEDSLQSELQNLQNSVELPPELKKQYKQYDNFKLHFVGPDGNELQSVDRSNLKGILSMAAVYIDQDFTKYGSATDKLFGDSVYKDYCAKLFDSTHIVGYDPSEYTVTYCDIATGTKIENPSSKVALEDCNNQIPEGVLVTNEESRSDKHDDYLTGNNSASQGSNYIGGSANSSATNTSSSVTNDDLVGALRKKSATVIKGTETVRTAYNKRKDKYLTSEQDIYTIMATGPHTENYESDSAQQVLYNPRQSNEYIKYEHRNGNPSVFNSQADAANYMKTVLHCNNFKDYAIENFDFQNKDDADFEEFEDENGHTIRTWHKGSGIRGSSSTSQLICTCPECRGHVQGNAYVFVSNIYDPSADNSSSDENNGDSSDSKKKNDSYDNVEQTGKETRFSMYALDKYATASDHTENASTGTGSINGTYRCNNTNCPYSTPGAINQETFDANYDDATGKSYCDLGHEIIIDQNNVAQAGNSQEAIANTGDNEYNAEKQVLSSLLGKSEDSGFTIVNQWKNSNQFTNLLTNKTDYRIYDGTESFDELENTPGKNVVNESNSKAFWFNAWSTPEKRNRDFEKEGQTNENITRARMFMAADQEETYGIKNINGTGGRFGMALLPEEVAALLENNSDQSTLPDDRKALIATCLALPAGHPYISGGTAQPPGVNPLPGAMSCASFVQQAFNTACPESQYKNIGITTEALIQNLNKNFVRISVEELRPGDIGLKRNDRGSYQYANGKQNQNHIGIYAGTENGQLKQFHESGHKDGYKKNAADNNLVYYYRQKGFADE